MKIGAIQHSLPARKQVAQHPQPVERRGNADQPQQAQQTLAASDLHRPVYGVGKQRAIDFYIITEAISNPAADGELIGIDTFA